MASQPLQVSLADFRRDYTRAGLREEDLDPDPFRQFQKWLDEAITAGLTEPHAMVLSTTGPDHQPSSRLMMLQGISDGGFVFYTSTQSRKCRELAAHRFAALNFPWLELERQVNVGGRVGPVSPSAAEAYFKTRPRGFRLAVWAFHPNQTLPDRATMEARLRQMEARFPGEEIPAPPDWTGYVLKPEEIEFWQGRPNRLHDRLRYRLVEGGAWRIERLSP